MNHRILLENTFSGPMDLLLYLVKRDEIDIHDIPIAHLTREYLAEIERMPTIDVDLASEFMTMASVLVEIKSRMLLPPTESVDGEDDEDTLDPRAGLVKALLEYKRFKEIAAELGKLADDHANRFARFAPVLQVIQDEPATIEELGVMDLFAAFQKMVRTLTTQSPREIVNDEVPTEVRMEQVTTALQGRDRATFTSLLSDNPTKGEMVGFFIALLELIRLRLVRARQSLDFSEIYLFAPGEEETLDTALDAPPLLRRRPPRGCVDPAKAQRLQASGSFHPGARVALFPAMAITPPVKERMPKQTAFLSVPIRAAYAVGAGLSGDGHRAGCASGLVFANLPPTGVKRARASNLQTASAAVPGCLAPSHAEASADSPPMLPSCDPAGRDAPSATAASHASPQSPFVRRGHEDRGAAFGGRARIARGRQAASRAGSPPSFLTIPCGKSAAGRAHRSSVVASFLPVPTAPASQPSGQAGISAFLPVRGAGATASTGAGGRARIPAGLGVAARSSFAQGCGAGTTGQRVGRPAEDGARGRLPAGNPSVSLAAPDADETRSPVHVPGGLACRVHTGRGSAPAAASMHLPGRFPEAVTRKSTGVGYRSGGGGGMLAVPLRTALVPAQVHKPRTPRALLAVTTLTPPRTERGSAPTTPPRSRARAVLAVPRFLPVPGRTS